VSSCTSVPFPNNAVHQDAQSWDTKLKIYKLKTEGNYLFYIVEKYM
jgi:hypothetical protein